MRVLVLQHIACEHPGVFSRGDARARRRAGRRRGRRGRAAARLARVRRRAGDGRADGRRRRRRPSLAGAGARAGARARSRPAGRSSASASGSSCWRPRCGARVYAAERPEVGLLEVELTAEGRADPLFAGLDDRFVSLQWHGDTFDLPADAVRLASSPLIANQAFRAGERAYGVQFHLEVTGEMAVEWGGVPAYRDSLAGDARRARPEPPSSPTSNGAPTSFTRPPGGCSPTGSSSPRRRLEGPRRGMYLFVQSPLYSGAQVVDDREETVGGRG